jgi:voltage-gated potassium channel
LRKFKQLLALFDLNSTRQKIHRIIFGVDTPAGRGFDIVLLMLIIASITILMLESVEGINLKWAGLFFQ